MVIAEFNAGICNIFLSKPQIVNRVKCILFVKWILKCNPPFLCELASVICFKAVKMT